MRLYNKKNFMAGNIDDKNKEVKSEEKSGLSVLKKILIGVVVVTVFILGAAYWIGTNEEYVTKKIEDWRAERYEKALKKRSDEMRARYAADTDGGKTPEETLDLFIMALKAGDIEKASKYYVLEKQEEELRHLKEMLSKYGNLQKSIDFYSEIKTKGVKKCNQKKDGCVFEYLYVSTDDRILDVSGRNEKIFIPAGEQSLRSESFTFNKYTNVWKIGQ